VSDLLDANVLIALAVDDHVHHDVAEQWFASNVSGFATSPITQGALLRQLLRTGNRIAGAQRLLADFVKDPRHDFWPDVLTYRDVQLYGVIGHKQVTDAYLAALARANRGRLVTFDRGLAALHPDVAVLVPTPPHLPDPPHLPEQRPAE
jgi:uncharacterized protein